ncbi:UDP-N-acetylglucosamine 2-epimerase [Candidatus Pelagibacter bacterium nBUS_49]|uniref:UDP-N-acetylglucosamine 2-epimerase n=1 Tax=Candidatus Pelagibacter bacterium nBUS_49 TaxID=3374196 RepID=UPI003EBF3229
MKSKKIIFITSSRADYGLLRNLILEVQRINPETYLLVTGSHLSKEFGETILEIKKDKIKNIIKKKILSNNFKDKNILKYIQQSIKVTSDVIEKLSPSNLVILGDRYELLGCAIAATILRIPITHLHGGEITIGSYDDSIRHSISKLSHLHFPIHQIYKKRLIQLGEDPKTIFNYGSLGAYSIKNIKLFSKIELEQNFNIKLDKKIILATFHPVTLEKDKAQFQISNLIKFLKTQHDKIIIFTSPNFDNENKIIKKQILSFVKKRKNVYFFNSLGNKYYTSFMNIAHLVIGNSSSGVLETPSFGTRTINIGDRQKGRIFSKNIINSDYKVKSIYNAYLKIINKPKKKTNIFYRKNTPQNIARKIISFKFNLKKKFYDL